MQSFPKQDDRRGVTASPLKKSIEQYVSVEPCKNCCDMYDKITQLEKKTVAKSQQPIDKSIQIVTFSTRDQSTTMNPEEDKAYLQSSLKKMQETDKNILSREKILKLLDQAQINTPLDASRINPGKEEYASLLDTSQRHRQVVPLEKLLFGDC